MKPLRNDSVAKLRANERAGLLSVEVFQNVDNYLMLRFRCMLTSRIHEPLDDPCNVIITAFLCRTNAGLKV